MELLAQGWTTKPLPQKISHHSRCGSSASSHHSLSSTSIPRGSISRDVGSIKVGDRERGGRVQKHAEIAQEILQANSRSYSSPFSKTEEKTISRAQSESDMFLRERLCIPKGRSQAGRVLTNVRTMVRRYGALPEMPESPRADPEKQKEATERLSRIVHPFANIPTPCSPTHSDVSAPLVSVSEQRAYMEKLAVPPNPVTLHKVKKQQKEEKERLEHKRRLEQVREWQARQRTKLSLIDQYAQMAETKIKSQSASSKTTCCNSETSSTAAGDHDHEETDPVIHWDGNWETVLQGLQTLEGKLDDDRIPLQLHDSEASRKLETKKKRPRSAPHSTREKFPHLRPLLDELLWVLIFALQGAKALNSRERLELLLIPDVLPTLRKAGNIPVASATLKRLETASARLARSLMTNKGGASISAEDMQLQLENCRDALLHKEYVQSAFDVTLASQPK